MSINVYFIRHGFSYANATHMGIVVDDHTKYIDSPLTTTGLEFSETAGKRITKYFKKKKINIEGVYCSLLMRAIQTACKMFPENEITPICHIKELDNENADRLENGERKMKKLGRMFPKTKIKGEKLFSKCKNSTDYEKFLKFIENKIDEEKNIVVVTHSMYMKRNLHMKLPRNNEVYKVTYVKTPNGVYQTEAMLVQEGMKSIKNLVL
jgi:broad specificity phosphatase PhoE